MEDGGTDEVALLVAADHQLRAVQQQLRSVPHSAPHQLHDALLGRRRDQRADIRPGNVTCHPQQRGVDTQSGERSAVRTAFR